jgi:hypothetical protein
MVYAEYPGLIGGGFQKNDAKRDRSQIGVTRAKAQSTPRKHSKFNFKSLTPFGMHPSTVGRAQRQRWDKLFLDRAPTFLSRI